MSLDLAKVLTGWLRLIDYDNDCEKIIEANPCDSKTASRDACAAQLECETGIVHKTVYICNEGGCAGWTTKSEYSECYLGKEFNALIGNAERAQKCAFSLSRTSQQIGDARRFRAVKTAESLVFSDTWRIDVIKPQ